MLAEYEIDSLYPELLSNFLSFSLLTHTKLAKEFVMRPRFLANSPQDFRYSRPQLNKTTLDIASDELLVAPELIKLFLADLGITKENSPPNPVEVEIFTDKDDRELLGLAIKPKEITKDEVGIYFGHFGPDKAPIAYVIFNEIATFYPEIAKSQRANRILKEYNKLILRPNSQLFKPSGEITMLYVSLTNWLKSVLDI